MSRQRQPDPYETHADPGEPPSKSQLKRDMEALQELGKRLVSLSRDQLAQVPMPDNLRDAVLEAQRIPGFGAMRRQLQYIGKLMRNVDPEPIRAMLAVWDGSSREATARMHRIERLRDDLLADEKVLTRIADEHPGADLQKLRQLRRNALKEKEAGKPPKSYREIFRMLKALEEGADESAGEAEDFEDHPDGRLAGHEQDNPW